MSINKKKLHKIRYDKYPFSTREKIRYFIQGMILDVLISYLFFRSIWAVIILFPVVPVYLKRKGRELNRKRQESIRQQFKDAIQAVLAALEAGYSTENAFEQAQKELCLLYGKQTEIIREFRRIVHGIRMNQNIEDLLQEFAERSKIEDIDSFADIFIIAKRKGGNLLLIIRSTVQVISEKTEVNQEIQTLMAGKRLEQRIMNVVPLGILFYVNLTSRGFLDVLYESLMGRGIMSICLAAYFGAVLLSEKITCVEV